MKLMDALELLFEGKDGYERLASKDVPPHAEAAFHEARAAYYKEKEASAPTSPVRGKRGD